MVDAGFLSSTSFFSTVLFSAESDFSALNTVINNGTITAKNDFVGGPNSIPSGSNGIVRIDAAVTGSNGQGYFYNPYFFDSAFAEIIAIAPCPGQNNGKDSLVMRQPGDGFDIEWSNGSTDPVAINLSPGNYSVTITNVNGCTKVLSNTIPSANSAPTITGSATASENQSGTYSVPQSPGYNYNWTVTGGTITSATDSNLVTVEWGSAGTGTITLNLTDLGACPLDASVLNVTITEQNTVGIENADFDFSIKAFPNPVSNNLTLNIQSNKETELDLRIFDLSGKNYAALNRSITVLQEHNQLIDLSALAAGTYFIRLINQDAQSAKTIKILKTN
jgi:hypothetical protein